MRPLAPWGNAAVTSAVAACTAACCSADGARGMTSSRTAAAGYAGDMASYLSGRASLPLMRHWPLPRDDTSPRQS